MKKTYNDIKNLVVEQLEVEGGQINILDVILQGQTPKMNCTGFGGNQDSLSVTAQVYYAIFIFNALRSFFEIDDPKHTAIFMTG